MAGPLTIQRFPKGLIELLGMRSTGETPAQLAPDVSAGIDLLDMYLLDRMQVANFGPAITIPSTGDINCLINSLPAGPAGGFIWLVYGISFSTGVVAAAASIQTHLGIRRAQIAARNVLLTGMDTGLVAAAGVATRAIHYEKPMIMRPGDQLAYTTSVYTGAPGVLPFGLIYYAEVGI